MTYCTPIDADFEPSPRDGDWYARVVTFGGNKRSQAASCDDGEAGTISAEASIFVEFDGEGGYTGS